MVQNNNLDIEKKIQELINEVVAKVDNNWPTIYKVRYIYLEIGKRLYKDVDFFFSVDGKLGEANLSIAEIKDIYNDYIVISSRMKNRISIEDLDNINEFIDIKNRSIRK